MANRLPFPLLITATLLILISPRLSAQPIESELAPVRSITTEELEAKVAKTEAASGLEDEVKNTLLDLYRKALGNLKAAGADTRAAEDYARIIEEGPARIETLREATLDLQAQDPRVDLDVAQSEPLPQLVQRLEKEIAKLAVLRAQDSETENRLAEVSARPALIRQQLPLVRQQQEELAGQLKQQPGAGEDPATAQAHRWELESRSQKLHAEIKKLNQELLSQPVRLELLRIEQDKVLADKELSARRVELLRNLVDQQRQVEAEQTRAQAETIRESAEGKDPIIVRLAEQNAALTEDIAGATSVLGTLIEQTAHAERRARRIEADFKSAKEIIDVGGLTHQLGQLLLQQRFLLPDLRTYRHEVRERESIAARVGVRRLKHRQEQRRLRDLDAYIVALATAEAREITAEVEDELRTLARERQALLDRAIETDDLYLGKLGELESAQQRLLGQIQGFDEFVDTHLLWVRSSSPADLVGLGASSEHVWRMLSPKGWLEVGHSLRHQIIHSPVFALLILVLGVLLWWRKRIIAGIPELRTAVGKPRIDRFSFTLQAFVLTLLAAAGLPLLMFVTGWQLKVSSEGTSFSVAVGHALVVVAVLVFFVRFLRMACIEHGLAEAHYRWPAARVQLLRTELDRLTWIFLPAAMVAAVANQLDPLNGGWAIGRIAFLTLAVSLSFAFHRLLHPGKGVFAPPPGLETQPKTRRLRWLAYLALVAAPLLLGGVAAWGYLLAAGSLFKELLAGLSMLISVWILWELALRWLLIAQRRLAYEAAVEERRARWAARQEQEGGEEHSQDPAALIEAEEPAVDLVALSETSKKLLDTVFVFVGVIGLWMVWVDVLPALRIFDAVTLWNRTEVVDGVEQTVAVTLAHIGMTVIYAIATIILMKQLPAVLEIVLLKYTEMSAPSRYTATTLTNYLVAIAGLVLVSTTIGLEWSKLQWLVAALGVGIGFGLQEIVANFISGLIILFEKPVRVGDLITVGEASGRVTRIRIRATTIRDFEQKELLIPNKELITGHLLNWSLSDEMMRILINVGIAYGSDVDRAMEILLELANEDERVLEEPPPGVVFDQFGDNSLNLAFRMFVGTIADRLPVMTDMHREIHRRFAEAGITIAFPQRDIHLDKEAPLRVEIVGSAQAPASDAK